MKASRSFGQLAAAMLSMSTVSAAWPNIMPDLGGFIVRRAETTADATDAANTVNLNTGSESTSTPTTKATASKTTATATGTEKTTGTDKTTGTGKTTATGTGKTTAKATTGKTTAKATTGKTTASANSTSIDAAAAAGGITLLTPTSVTGATQLYKIGDYVTWVWNYTSLQVTPTALDVLVSCSFATSTYTLTQNMTFETLGSYTWDTGAYETAHANAQLLTQEYTLIIYDADSKMTAAAEGGYLDKYDSFTFGMYAAQSYTALADGWTCATCSGAVSDMEKRALGFAMTMSLITVLSFTWFVTGMRLTL